MLDIRFVRENPELVKENMRHLVKLVGPNEGSTVSSIMLKTVAERVKDYKLRDQISNEDNQTIRIIIKDPLQEI